MAVATRPYAPPRIGQPVNTGGAVTRAPVRSNVDQIAIPQTAATSQVGPVEYVGRYNVPGTHTTVEIPYRTPGNIGEEIYRPIAGDPVDALAGRGGRSPRNISSLSDTVNSSTNQPPLRTGASPVNRGGGGASGGRTPNPGRGVNNNVVPTGGLNRATVGNYAAGGALAGGFTAYSTARNGGGFFETLGAGVGGAAGATAGGLAGAAAGGAAGGAVGTVSVPIAGAVPGAAIGAAVGGAVGGSVGAGIGASALGRAGRAIDNAIPDFPLPWPFNGRGEDFPNQTNPSALDNGPQTAPGDPGTVATGSRAIPYNVQWRNPGTSEDTFFGQTSNVGTPDWQVLGQRTGPISIQDRGENGSWLIHATGEDAIGGGSYTAYSQAVDPVTGQLAPYPVIVAANPQFGAAAVDGSTDPVIGAAAPTYAPNPARRTPASSPRPRTLPPPVATPQPGLQPTGRTNPNGAPEYAPGPHPWPYTDPARSPESPLAPTPDAPPNFQPSDLGDPAPTFDPAKDIASQPDLDNPAKEAPALQGNPGTPPAPEALEQINPSEEEEERLSGWRINGQPAEDLNMTWGDRGPVTRINGREYPGVPRVSRDPAGGLEVRRNPDGSTSIFSDPRTQITGLPGVNPQSAQRPQVPLIVPLPMRQPAITPRNPQQPFPPQQPDPQTPQQPNTNPNVDNRPRPEPPSTPNPNPRATCQYERARVMDVQRKATDTQQRASNPTSGFPGLYGLQIESRIKQGQIFDIVTATKDFMRKAWETTRIQKVLDVLTFIGVMHNVSMLSRDVGETFFQLITSSFQAVGIRDEEGGVIDVQEVVGDATESFLRRILTDQVYDGLNEAWNKANRIISSASAVIWSIRSMGDASLDLLEWVGEHTGRIGNALKRWGVVGERAYPWMSEKPRAFPKGRRWLNRASEALETVEDHLSVYQQAASSVIEVQEEIQETGENIDRFTASILDAVPDPWADNNPILSRFTEDKGASAAPDISPADAQQGS